MLLFGERITSFYIIQYNNIMHFLSTLIVALSLSTAMMQAAPLDGDLFDGLGDALDSVVKRDIPDLIERDTSYCSE